MHFKGLFGNDSFSSQTIKIIYKQHLNSEASGFPLQADNTPNFSSQPNTLGADSESRKKFPLRTFFFFFLITISSSTSLYQLTTITYLKLIQFANRAKLAHPASSLPKIHPSRLLDSAPRSLSPWLFLLQEFFANRRAFHAISDAFYLGLENINAYIVSPEAGSTARRGLSKRADLGWSCSLP